PPGQRSAGQLAADPAGRGRCRPATAPLPAATGRPGRTDAAPGAPAGLAAPGSRRSGSPRGRPPVWRAEQAVRPGPAATGRRTAPAAGDPDADREQPQGVEGAGEIAAGPHNLSG